KNEGDASYALNLLAGASDKDDGETASLSVAGVTYAVDGGLASGTAPAGLSRSGASLTVDPANAAFDHLAVGASTTIVVGYDVTDAQGATVHQTETITIHGTNDGPSVSAALTSDKNERDASYALDLLAGASDKDDGETASLSVAGVTYAVDGGLASGTAPAGLSRVGASLTVDPTNAAFDHLAVGASTTIVVGYDVTDAQGATVHQTETITIHGTNDGPSVSAALTSDKNERDASYALDLLAGASDKDDGETASLSVAGVTYAVDGGLASGTAPAGLSRVGASLTVDPTNAAFDHLAVGASTTIVVGYDVTDAQGATVHQTETITIHGTNDGPSVSAALTSDKNERDASYALDLLAGASDKDDGETASLSVAGVTYAVDGGLASGTAPAGLSRVGASLTVDPTNGAFDHLAVGASTTIVVGYEVTDAQGATVHQTETITIHGTNDGPSVSAALTSDKNERDASYALDLLAGASDKDDGETASLSVAGVTYAVDGGLASGTAPAGLSRVGASLTVDPTNGAFDHLAVGASTTIVVGYEVTDAQGATVHQTETITIHGTNDGPSVSAALTSDKNERDASYALDLLAGASDKDDGETASLSVAGVTYAVDGGLASGTAPAGLSRVGASLTVDPTNGAFDHLAVGASTTIVVGYEVTDAQGATVHQTETITIHGTNDGPVVSAALTDSSNEGAASHVLDLLAGASDKDDGETASLSVAGVTYAVDGGLASGTAPAGLSRVGASLTVDPTNAAFDHLAVGASTTIVVGYDVTDAQGATVHQTETITIHGTNDGPTVSAALTSDKNEGDASYALDLLAGASDKDDGETATLSVAGVTYAVDGGLASGTAPAGLSRVGASLTVDPTNAAFDHLAVGASTTIVVGYDVTDAQGATVHQTETIT